MRSSPCYMYFGFPPSLSPRRIQIWSGKFFYFRVCEPFSFHKTFLSYY
jgi:hypothetical protein